jgi:hypothetical protein
VTIDQFLKLITNQQFVDVVGAGLDRHIWDAMLIGEKGGIVGYPQSRQSQSD